jgi:hypothetical protein
MLTTTIRYLRRTGSGVGRRRLWCLSTIVSTLLIGNPVPAWAKIGPTPTCAHNTCKKVPSHAKPAHGADAGDSAIEPSDSAPRSGSSGGHP